MQEKKRTLITGVRFMGMLMQSQSEQLVLVGDGDGCLDALGKSGGSAAAGLYLHEA